MLALLMLIFLILFVCLYFVDPHIGVTIVNSVKQQSGNPERFLFHLFSMLGKLASIDGHVDRAEFDYVKKLSEQRFRELKEAYEALYGERRVFSRGYSDTLFPSLL